MSGARPGGDVPGPGLSPIADADGEYGDGDESFNKDDSFAAEIAAGDPRAEPFRFSLLDDFAALDAACFKTHGARSMGKGLSAGRT